MVRIKGKIHKEGNSYAIRIPKVLIDTEVLENGKIYEFTLIPHNPDYTKGSFLSQDDNYLHFLAKIQ